MSGFNSSAFLASLAEAITHPIQEEKKTAKTTIARIGRAITHQLHASPLNVSAIVRSHLRKDTM
ncbi:MAG: hypothetical protein QXE92_01850 [Thermofilaceae archaeon]